MNYIGSKHSLLPFLQRCITEVAGNDFKTFCDMFSGTASVGLHFKKMGYKIISNDIQYYSYAIARHFIGNNKELNFSGIKDQLEPNRKTLFDDIYSDVCKHLSNLEGIEGFIFNNYCPGGTQNKEFQRMYFTDHNGRLCDSIRAKIEEWYISGEITEDEYYYLLVTLLKSIDKYANTASVYGAFLKKFKASALKEMTLSPLPLYQSSFENETYNQDTRDLIKHISGDVLYLDPPYNQRQYAANYHLLETIAKYDNPAISGLTGMRDYGDTKSNWCYKRHVADELDFVIQNADFKYVFLSYNNEGLMSLEQIKEIMSAKGEYGLFKQRYSRFKADRDENRNHKSAHTFEYLHYVIIKSIEQPRLSSRSCFSFDF